MPRCLSETAAKDCFRQTLYVTPEYNELHVYGKDSHPTVNNCKPVSKLGSGGRETSPCGMYVDAPAGPSLRHDTTPRESNPNHGHGEPSSPWQAYPVQNRTFSHLCSTNEASWWRCYMNRDGKTGGSEVKEKE